jgi:hypothetical protein
VIAAAVTAPVGTSRADLITNGDFETNGGPGQIGLNTTADGWSLAGSPNYTFLFTSAANAMAGATGEFGSLALWGPDNGSANGFTDSPNGGAFIAQDSAFQQSAIQQTITGLTVGQQYTLSFDWAAAQQSGFDGPSSSQWQVSLGSEEHDTAFANIPGGGFSGWMHQSFTYTATADTEVLSFFANGSPQVPPFALLDSVTLTAIPEPSTMIASLTMFGLFGTVWAYKRLKVRA